MKKVLCMILAVTTYYLLLTTYCLYAKQDTPVPVFIFNGKPVDAKAIGMGEAFAAVSDNASASYWNPAGLKQLEGKYFTTCINTSQKTDASDDDLFAGDSLQGKKLIFMGFANSKSAFSFRPISNYSSIYEDKKIELRVNKYTFSSASQYTDRMKLGINLNYISAQLGVTDLVNPVANISDGNGIAIDFGLLYSASEFAKLGFSVENSPGYIWWTDYKRNIIKSHIRTGLSIKPADWLLMSFDYENIASLKKEFYHGGLQQTLAKHIFLRQGIISEKFFNNGDLKSLTIGGGYELKKWIIDFAAKSYQLANTDKSKVTDYFISLNIPF
ncbi:MAG: hypothetical protein HY919_03485 [Elusimicrobia bacterium]|nr:hypothetical protein [Elusimicrobiota bacterium]